MVRLSRLSIRSSVWAVLLVAAGAPACDSPVDTASFDPPIDTLACVAADLPAGFGWQAAGGFTEDDLAGVPGAPEQRLDRLQEVGVRAGYFSNWRSRISKPPFQPPVDLTCQVIAFESETGARAFVNSLSDAPEGVVLAAITWLPDGAPDVEQVSPADGLPDGSLQFHIRAADGGLDVNVNAVVMQAGPFVQVVFAGGEAGDPERDAPAAAAALSERTRALLDASGQLP